MQLISVHLYIFLTNVRTVLSLRLSLSFLDFLIAAAVPISLAYFPMLHLSSGVYFTSLIRTFLADSAASVAATWLATCAGKPKVPGTSPAASYVQR